jgi:hypothetical protein
MLEIIFKKEGTLIEGDFNYINRWSSCISHPNWTKCLENLNPDF